ncbi:MAG: NADH-ubiquinone oxidoreductase-F iron-sulfur binding region domain-containing protein [Candidatus Marinimicrobia bacterium]|nr:NADH-ubiquinone oxidoreductase-F iron-sulfur binding region domain-containing protein [Candidatus Neomarinimicrobiota bacterium]
MIETMKIRKIKVGLASCGLAAGGRAVYDAFQKALPESIELQKTACLGFCYAEPMAEVIDEDGESRVYGYLSEKDIPAFVSGTPPEKKLILSDSRDAPANAQLAKQVRIVTRNSGRIDPENIRDYLDSGGYRSLKKACTEMTPQEVINTIRDSGLRGRGGAGFPTGRKWQFAKDAPGDKKYIICNADEGDPGAFMDRNVLESDPHSVLEGMAICAYAVGADEAYIYCRAEYPLAVKRLRKAISDAEAAGYLGKDLFNSRFDLRIKIKEGAGAFVCGEETALIASIEGRRGMPRLRPPFPAQSGIWGKPTNNNNVETYASVAWIIGHGPEAYAAYGTEKSRGTKVFALAGKVRHTGLVEVPMGMTLRQIIFDIGGGIENDRPFKAVQLGGPSGGCLPESLLDTPVDYESIVRTGAIMGSGGMVVMDDSICMVNISAFFLNFTQNESCGKCTFCRIGTRRMLEILRRIQNGDGKLEDIGKLEALAEQITASSLCGLGKTAPNPVLTTLRYFKDEYIAHIEEKHCPAGVCSALVTYRIDEEACTGCTLCARSCPVNAISGAPKQAHEIVQDICISCGACYRVCRFNAVIRS